MGGATTTLYAATAYNAIMAPKVPGSKRRGTIPSTCTDFKIDPPSFLTVAIKNEIPVHVEMTWRPM